MQKYSNNCYHCGRNSREYDKKALTGGERKGSYHHRYDLLEISLRSLCQILLRFWYCCFLSGPATVGGIKPGCFRIGNTGGMMDNIIRSKLYRPGSVAYVSRWAIWIDDTWKNICWNLKHIQYIPYLFEYWASIMFIFL